MTRTGKRRLGILVVLALLVAAGGFGLKLFRQAQQASAARAARDRGVAAYQAGEYAKALPDLSRAVSYDKSDAHLLVLYGECRLRIPLENGSHILQAAASFRQASLDDPKNPEPLSRLLDVYQRLGYNTERRETAEKLLQLDPVNHDALVAIIECDYVLGQPAAERLADAQQLIKAYPAESLGYEWALHAMDSMNTSAADMLKYIDDVAARFADDIPIQILRAQAYAREGRLDDARKFAAQLAQAAHPSRSEDARNLITLLDSLRLGAEADSLLHRLDQGAAGAGMTSALVIERAWKHGRLDIVKSFLTDHADTTGDTSLDDDTLGWLTFLEIQDSPGSPSIPVRIAQMRQRNHAVATYWCDILEGARRQAEGDPAAAQARFAAAQSGRADADLPVFLLANVDYAMGEDTMAVSRLETLVAAEPTWSQARNMLIDLYLSRNDFQRARQLASRAPNAAPTAGDVFILARVYVAMVSAGVASPDDVKAADTMLSALHKDSPDNPDVTATYARFLVLDGRTGAAAPLISALIESTARRPQQSILLDLAQTCINASAPQVNDLLAYASGDQSGAGGASDGGPRLIVLKAGRLQEEGKTQEAAALFTTSITQAASASDRLALQVAYARFLDGANDPQAVNEFKTLSASAASHAFVQRAVLDSRAAWSDRQLVQDAIDRLRKLTSGDLASWQIYDARKLMTFAPDADSAAKAIIELSPLVKQAVVNPLAVSLIADAYILRNDRPDAIAALKKALTSNQTTLALYPRLIELLRLEGKSDQARQWLVQFQQQPIPDADTPMRRLRANLLASMGSWSDALTQFRSLAAQTKLPADQAMVGQLLVQTGDAKGAQDVFDRLSKLTITDPNSLSVIANYYALAGRTDEGISILHRESELAPAGTIDAYRIAKLVGDYLESNGRADQAHDQFVKTAATFDTPSAWADLVRFELRRKNIDAARQAISDGLKKSPQDPELSALSSLCDVLQGGSLTSDEAKRLSTVLVAEGQRDTFLAMVKADNYLTAHPEDVEGYIGQLQAIASAHPTELRIWRTLIGYAIEHNFNDRAATFAQQASQAMPMSLAASQLAADTFIQAGQMEQALAAAMHCRDLNPSNTFDADCVASYALMRLGKYDQGLNLIIPWQADIIAGSDTNQQRVEQLAALLVLTGQPTEADTILWPLVQKSPQKWGLIYLRVGSANKDAGITRAWLQKIHPLLAKDEALMAPLAVFWYQYSLKNPDDSIGFSQCTSLIGPQVLDGSPDGAKTPTTALLALAESYRAMQQFEQAEKVYRKILAIAPDQPVVLNNLAYLLVQMKSPSLDEARTLAQRAVEEVTTKNIPVDQRATFIDTLGSVLLAQSKVREATDTYQKALVDDPANPTLQVGLIESLLAAGKHEEAKKSMAALTQSLAKRQEPLSRDTSHRLDNIREMLAQAPN